jgi:hypothetical protein
MDGFNVAYSMNEWMNEWMNDLMCQIIWMNGWYDIWQWWQCVGGKFKFWIIVENYLKQCQLT